MPSKSLTAMNQPTTALIYTRVSTEEQSREGVSLDAQLTECRRYVAQLSWIVEQEYLDVLSGKRDDRPAYQALLAEVRRLRASGQPVVVVVFRLDRLGRRIAERVRCWEEMKALGVPVHSVREGGAVPELVANVLASVAQEESRALGERVAASIRQINERGWYVPTRPPWGYRLQPATAEERAQGAPASVLIPDPATAPWVQEAFSRAANGETVHAVHRWATSLPSQARGDRVLTYRAVRQILGSPVYIARLPVGNDHGLARPRGRWEPLVDEATWVRIQDRIASHQLLPRQASQRYLLTGLLRCPQCGERMNGRGRAGHSPSYRCSAVNQGANAATRLCFSTALARQVDDAVLAEVLPLIATATSTLPELRDALARAWSALQTPTMLQGEVRERQRQQVERDAAKARARLTNAAVLFADGDIDKSGYELLRDKARADLHAATEVLAGFEPTEQTATLPPMEDVLAAAAGWGVALHGSDIAAQREVLATLIERVLPLRTGRGKYAVEISWTPLGDGLHALVSVQEDIAERSAA